jgi:beta-lactamase regulating signal transducer with metallopeptidase domain
MLNLDIFANSALSTLAQISIKSSLIVLLAAAINRILRRRTAALRHIVWTAALASTILIALIGAALPAWHIVPVPQRLATFASTASAQIETVRTVESLVNAPTAQIVEPPARNLRVKHTQRAAPVSSASPVAAPAANLSKASAHAHSSADSTNWRMVMLVAWLFGAAMMLARYVISSVRVRQLLRHSQRVLAQEWLSLEQRVSNAFGIERPVILLTSEHVDVPITCGVIYPRVVLPSSAGEWTDARKHAVLSHELAHVKRFDAATQWLAFGATVLCWFNPLVWYAVRQMRFERERACDDFVLANGARASEYASDLLAIVSSFGNSDKYRVALAMARRSQFEGRLVALLDPALDHKYLTRTALAIVTVVALGVLIPLGVAQVANTGTPAAPARTDALPAPAPQAPAANTNAASHVEAPAPQPQDHMAHSAGPAPVAEQTPAPATPAESAAPAPGAPQGPSPSSPMAAPAPAAPPASARRATASTHTQDSAAFSSGVFAPCRGSGSEHRNTNISNSDDNGEKDWSVTVRGGNCDIDLRARGKFRFKGDLTGIEYVGADSYVKMSSSINGESDKLEARPGANGLAVTYSRNGQQMPMDARATAWLHDFLTELDRSSAFAVDTRLPQLLAEGGPARVLQETAQMNDYPRATYIAALMNKAQLPAADAREVVRQAGATSSDYYSAQMLTAIANKYSLNDPVIGTQFTDALDHLKSDYYHTEVLKTYLNKGAPITAQQADAFLRSTTRMSSDYYITEVLKQMADKHLIASSAWPTYLEAENKVHSDYYRTELLNKLLQSYSGDPGVVASSILAAQSIGSDYYKLEVLRGARNRFKIEGSVRDAYMKVARSIQSETYRKEAMNGMEMSGVL